MTSMQLNNNAAVLQAEGNNIPNRNFKAGYPVAQYSQYQQYPTQDNFIRQESKQEKRQKITTWAAVITAAAFGAMALVQVMTGKAQKAALKAQEGYFNRGGAALKDEAQEKLYKLINTEKSTALQDLSYEKKTRSAIDTCIERIKKADVIKKKGGSGKGISVLLYGPPGTGKNTATEAIAKEFKGSKLYDLDISGLNSKYYGETEHNILNSVEEIVKEAKANPDKKIFVFIDEIDSVMMKDPGNGAKHSNDVLNAFKKGFNQLTKEQNIVTVGATNLKLDAETAKKEGKILDEAMLSRFGDKVLIDLPTKDQILNAITKHYTGNPEYTMVEKELTDSANSKLVKIADFLSNKKRETSFRTLNSLYENAAILGKETENCTVADLAKAIENKKDELHLTDSEVKSFLSSLGIK